MAFIRVAEDSGLIIPLGEWVVHTACAQNRAWLNRNFPPLRIAINLSATQFRHGGLFSTLQAALAQARLSADTLELELTESLLMDELVDAQALLERLHGEGKTRDSPRISTD